MKNAGDPMDENNRPLITGCGAKTRSGFPCQRAPYPGRTRCYFHGGAAGSGGPTGSRNGAYVDGHRSKEAMAERRWVRSLVHLLAKG